MKDYCRARFRCKFGRTCKKILREQGEACDEFEYK